MTLALYQECKYQSFGNPSHLFVDKGLLICVNKACCDNINEKRLKHGRRQLFLVNFNKEIWLSKD